MPSLYDHSIIIQYCSMDIDTNSNSNSNVSWWCWWWLPRHVRAVYCIVFSWIVWDWLVVCCIVLYCFASCSGGDVSSSLLLYTINTTNAALCCIVCCCLSVLCYLTTPFFLLFFCSNWRSSGVMMLGRLPRPQCWWRCCARSISPWRRSICLAGVWGATWGRAWEAITFFFVAMVFTCMCRVFQNISFVFVADLR